MNIYKNYLIALLTGLLVLTLTTRNATGAGSSKEERIVLYQSCVNKFLELNPWYREGNPTLATVASQDMAMAQVLCGRYRP